MASIKTNDQCEIKRKLEGHFLLLQIIRDFFRERDFCDVLTPPIVSQPGLEPHLHPFEVKGLGPIQHHEKGPQYLHTSPEFHMKELLSYGLKKIFTLSYCFRHEPKATHHRPQFVMLEWYRQGERYEQLMKDTDELLDYCLAKFEKNGWPIKSQLKTPLAKKTMDEVFREFAGVSYLDFPSANSLAQHIKKSWPEIPLPKEELSFDDLFHLVFLNLIEPRLKKYPKLLIYEYPASQAALSTLKPTDPRVCERFEIYLDGVELCNAFNELCCPRDQNQRASKQLNEKYSLYGYKLPHPTVLIDSLERGIKAPSAGIALGVERLLMAITGLENPFWE